jgi:hypothetical protein
MKTSRDYSHESTLLDKELELARIENRGYYIYLPLQLLIILLEIVIIYLLLK